MVWGDGRGVALTGPCMVSAGVIGLRTACRLEARPLTRRGVNTLATGLTGATASAWAARAAMLQPSCVRAGLGGGRVGGRPSV